MDLLALALSDDEDLLLLDSVMARSRKRRCTIQRSHVAFDLDALTDDYCWIHFRFKKLDILRLQQGLKIPNVIQCDNGTTVSGIEGLCMLLKRFAYPNRLFVIQIQINL